MALSAVRTSEFVPQGEFDTEVVPVKTWAASTAYVVGDIVRSSAASGNYYQCTVAGTSNSSAPTWTTTGTTVSDNSVTWQDIGAGYGGDLVKMPNGLIAYIDSLQSLDQQSGATFRYVRVGDVPKATGTTFADGANVWFNTATSLAVSSAPAQGFHIGVARGNWGSGKLTVRVVLNVGAGLLFSANTLTFGGLTGANEVRIPTNLADGLSIEDGNGDLIVFDTTTGTQVITITPALVVTGLITSNGGITLSGAVDLKFTGTNGQSEIVITDNLADALSIKDATGGADLVTFTTTNGAEAVNFATMLRPYTVATPVAAAGTDHTNGGALSRATVQHITSDGATKGVLLPTGAAGDMIVVINDSATAAEIYAAAGGTINGAGANASMVVPASKGVWCFCVSADTWVMFDMTAKATAS